MYAENEKKISCSLDTHDWMAYRVPHAFSASKSRKQWICCIWSTTKRNTHTHTCDPISAHTLGTVPYVYFTIFFCFAFRLCSLFVWIYSDVFILWMIRCFCLLYSTIHKHKKMEMQNRQIHLQCIGCCPIGCIEMGTGIFQFLRELLTASAFTGLIFKYVLVIHFLKMDQFRVKEVNLCVSNSRN